MCCSLACLLYRPVKVITFNLFYLFLRAQFSNSCSLYHSYLSNSHSFSVMSQHSGVCQFKSSHETAEAKQFLRTSLNIHLFIFKWKKIEKKLNATRNYVNAIRTLSPTKKNITKRRNYEFQTKYRKSQSKGEKERERRRKIAIEALNSPLLSIKLIAMLDARLSTALVRQQQGMNTLADSIRIWDCEWFSFHKMLQSK